MFTVTLPVYYTDEKVRVKSKTVLVSSNWFRNAHYYLKNNVKVHFENLIRINVKLNNHEKINEPYITRYRYYYKNKASDGSNVVSMLEKFFLDGMQKSGVLPEDNVLFHSSDGFRCFEDKKNPRIEIDVYLPEEVK